MNPTSKKLVGGLLTLLFIVSAVQSQAIVKLAKADTFQPNNQIAQVVAQPACLIVKTSLGTRVARGFYGEIGGQQYSGEDYMIGISIKNVCSNKVYVIDPSHFWPAGTIAEPSAAVGVDPVYGDLISESAMTSNFKVGVGSFPGITAYTNPIPTEFIVHTSVSLLGEYLLPEFTQGPADILSIPDSQLVGIEHSQPNMIAYGLLPNAVKKFWYFVPVIQPGFYPESTPNQNPDVNFSMTRLALKSIRWFRDTSYTADNLLSVSDIKTFNIPATLQSDFVTSGVAIGENY